MAQYAPQPAPIALPERCELHPSSRVRRDGKTKTRRGVERQRYLCFPKNGDDPHRFTPALLRPCRRTLVL